jgi:hypothetical protein
MQLFSDLGVHWIYVIFDALVLLIDIKFSFCLGKQFGLAFEGRVGPLALVQKRLSFFFLYKNQVKINLVAIQEIFSKP